MDFCTTQFCYLPRFDVASNVEQKVLFCLTSCNKRTLKASPMDMLHFFLNRLSKKSKSLQELHLNLVVRDALIDSPKLRTKTNLKKIHSIPKDFIFGRLQQ